MKKKRKCWLPAISHFPTMFSKGFFHRVVKSPDFVAELSLYQPNNPDLTTLYMKPFENIVGKGANAGYHKAFFLGVSKVVIAW